MGKKYEPYRHCLGIYVVAKKADPGQENNKLPRSDAVSSLTAETTDVSLN